MSKIANYSNSLKGRLTRQIMCTFVLFYMALYGFLIFACLYLAKSYTLDVEHEINRLNILKLTVMFQSKAFQIGNIFQQFINDVNLLSTMVEALDNRAI